MPVSAVLQSGLPDLDEGFVRGLRAGEPAPFAELVRIFTPRVRRMAMRYFKSPFDQEEAIQEAFLHVHRQRQAIDPLRRETVPSFVLTVARRRMLDLARARGAEHAREDIDDVELPDDAPPPDARAQDLELVGLLRAFEAKLKPAWRAFFHAVFVEGNDFDEARDAIGLGTLRAKYLKKVLLLRLRRHAPLLEYLGRAHP